MCVRSCFVVARSALRGRVAEVFFAIQLYAKKLAGKGHKHYLVGLSSFG